MSKVGVHRAVQKSVMHLFRPLNRDQSSSLMHYGGSPLGSYLRFHFRPVPGCEHEVILLALGNMSFKSTILVFDEKAFRYGTET